MGTKYWNGQLVGTKIEQVPGVLARGMWQYTPASDPVKLDNGLEINLGEKARLIEEKNQLFKSRK